MKFYPFQLDDLPHEIWRDILHYEGLYQVSNWGRVKSFNGRKGGKYKRLSIHRLKPQVDHKFDNSVWNLSRATSSENQKYALATGARQSGDYKAKFTQEQILYVRENPEGLNTHQLDSPSTI